VKAISTLVAHSPGEYAKVRLGSGERIFISGQQGVRISKLWFGVLPVATIYDRSKKDMVALEKALMTIMTWPATQGPDICGRILSRVLKECESVSDVSLLFKEVGGLHLACKEITPTLVLFLPLRALHLQSIALTRFVWGVVLLREDAFEAALPAFGEGALLEGFRVT
jgi:hypothetical protein